MQVWEYFKDISPSDIKQPYITISKDILLKIYNPDFSDYITDKLKHTPELPKELFESFIHFSLEKDDYEVFKIISNTMYKLYKTDIFDFDVEEYIVYYDSVDILKNTVNNLDITAILLELSLYPTHSKDYEKDRTVMSKYIVNNTNKQKYTDYIIKILENCIYSNNTVLFEHFLKEHYTSISDDEDAVLRLFAECALYNRFEMVRQLPTDFLQEDGYMYASSFVQCLFEYTIKHNNVEFMLYLLYNFAPIESVVDFTCLEDTYYTDENINVLQALIEYVRENDEEYFFEQIFENLTLRFAISNQLQCLRLLNRHNLINRKDIIYAVAYPSAFDAIRLMVDTFHIPATIRDNNPARYAMKNGSVEILRYLLTKPGVSSIIPEHTFKEFVKDTIGKDNMEEKHYETFKLSLEHGINNLQQNYLQSIINILFSDKDALKAMIYRGDIELLYNLYNRNTNMLYRHLLVYDDTKNENDREYKQQEIPQDVIISGIRNYTNLYNGNEQDFLTMLNEMTGKEYSVYDFSELGNILYTGGLIDAIKRYL